MVREFGPTAGPPTKLIMTLIYTDKNHSVFNAVGSQTDIFRYRVTSLPSMDPGNVGTIPFWTAMSSMYLQYRVLSYCVECVVSNNESFATTFFSIPLELDPGATPTIATVQGWLADPDVITNNISAKTGLDKYRMYHPIDCYDFVGSATQRFDDSYASGTSTNPVNNIWHVVGIYDQSNVYLNGVDFNIRISVVVEFFERQKLSI